ncbi:MAG: hypothetical protein ABSE49_11950 [Polyangiaceae bacterium]
MLGVIERPPKPPDALPPPVSDGRPPLGVMDAVGVRVGACAPSDAAVDARENCCAFARPAAPAPEGCGICAAE